MVFKYDVYGTFSSSEIAILWSASQYADIINILDYLRFLYFEDGGEQKRVFIATYTIVALNPYYKGDYKNVRGKALLQSEVTADSQILHPY